MSDHEKWEEPYVPADPPDWHHEWLEHLDFKVTEEQDRLIRHGDSFTGCVICHERPGKLIYGVKCAQCFEAQREERDAA